MLAWVLAMALCLSVTRRVLLKGLNELSCFGAWELKKEIRVSSKIMILPSRTSSHTLDLENFALACWLSKCVINFARGRWMLREWLDHRRSAKLTVPPNFDAQPLYSLSQWSSSCVYSMIPSHGSVSDRLILVFFCLFQKRNETLQAIVRKLFNPNWWRFLLICQMSFLTLR